MKKTALIAGSTGLVGSFLLQRLLEDDYYEKVTVLVRKPIDRIHPRLRQVVYEYDRPFADKVRADDIYCCLGTTIKKAGSKDAFRKVDYSYPLQIAQIAHENGATQYAVVTAMGSDEKSMFFYNRVKGQLEDELKKIPYDGLYIFRPSMLLGKRDEFRAGENIAKILMKLVRPLLPQNTRAIHASQVAETMFYHVKQTLPGIHYINSGSMQQFDVTNDLP